MPIWPIHTKPKEGELLSSWITRLARANHLATADFCKIVLPEKRTTLKEIDRIYNAEMMQALADGAGVPIEQVWKTSLLSEEGYVFSQRAFGTTGWISPTAAVKGIKARGMAYCPQCLDSDVEPYYRKDWRFVFNPVCLTHRTFLRHGCPTCGKPYNFFYASSTQASMANSITACRWCGTDMRQTSTPQNNSALIERVLAIQGEINEGIAHDSFTIPGYGYVHAQPYLKVLHACMNSLTTPAMARWVTRDYPVALPEGIDITALDRTDYAFVIEQRSPEGIGLLLCLAEALMKDWPDRFIRYIRKHEISPNRFFSGRVTPYWVTQTAGEFDFTKAGGFSKGEIKNARQILRKKLGRPESGSELRIFMTQGKVRHLGKVSSEVLKQVEFSPEHFKLRHCGPGEESPQKMSDKWKRLMESPAEQLAKIAVLRKPKREPAQNTSIQLDLFGG